MCRYNLVYSTGLLLVGVIFKKNFFFLLLPAKLQCTRIVTRLDVNVKVYLENNFPAEEVCTLNSDTFAKSYVTEAMPTHTPTHKGDNACFPHSATANRLSSWTYKNSFFQIFFFFLFLKCCNKHLCMKIYASPMICFYIILREFKGMNL